MDAEIWCYLLLNFISGCHIVPIVVKCQQVRMMNMEKKTLAPQSSDIKMGTAKASASTPGIASFEPREMEAPGYVVRTLLIFCTCSHLIVYLVDAYGIFAVQGACDKIQM